jgi:transglutaminase-like putative cysteine protease
MYRFNKDINTSGIPGLTSLLQSSESNVDTSDINKGIIRVHFDNIQKKMKVQINKDNMKYNYDYGENNIFPLQLGNGKYIISFYEFIKDKSYRLFKQESVMLQLNNENDIYLYPIQLVYWDDSMQAIKVGKELTKHKKKDLDKTKEIYKYIISKISYDVDKADTVESGYIPKIDQVLKEGKGICYDYSVLFAAMLRSNGIPTKLLMGYYNNSSVYHAWNQVYIKDERRWITLDTTQDSFNKRVIKNFYVKDENKYKVVKYY